MLHEWSFWVRKPVAGLLGDQPTSVGVGEVRMQEGDRDGPKERR